MTVLSAALIPAAPILVAGLGGQLDPASELRAAALLSLRALLTPQPERIVVVAEGDHDEEFDESCSLALHRLGGTVTEITTSARALPIPLAVAAALLSEAGWSGPITFRLVSRSASRQESVVVGTGLSKSAESIGLMILGNASACSTPKAPGSLHPDAEAFNLRVIELLRAGRGEGLDSLRADECKAQLSDVRIPLQVLAGVMPEFSARIHWAQEFGGVFSVIADIQPVAILSGERP